MKNKAIRLLSLLLSLVILTSGLPAFAEGDYDLVIAEVETGADGSSAPDLTEESESVAPPDSGEDPEAPEPSVVPSPEVIQPDAVDVQETAAPELNTDAMATADAAEETPVVEPAEPAAAQARFQNAQELADALGLTEEELSEELGIPAEDLEAMSPETLEEIYESFNPENAPVEIVPEKQRLEIGLLEQVSVAGWTLLPEGSVDSVSYSSESDHIATVSADGLVTGKNIGSTVICLHTAGGLTAEIDVEVKKAPTSVAFTNLGSSVGVGEEMQLEYAVPAGSAGFGYFASADNSIIDVSYEGWLSAKKVGKTKVAVATYNNKLKVVDVTVKPAPTDITLSAEEISIGAGDTRVLQYTLNAGSAGSVRYETADPAIASVEQNGAITAHKEGSTEITVETYNGLSKTCKVTVVPAPTEVTLTGERHEIGVGEKMQLTVAASPSQTVVSKVTYTSDNTRIAGVTAEGLVVGYRVGTATITATAYNGVSATYDITVVKAPTSVVFTNLGSSVGVGEEMQLEYAVPAGSAGFGYFASADNSIIDVSYEGWLSAKKVGKTKVAVATYNNKLKVVDVTVKPAPTDITLSAEEISIGAGDTRVLQYTLNAGSAGSVRYETANPAIATVEQNGAITAHKEGSTEITVETYNGLSKTCKVTVVPAPTEVTLTGERHEIGVGETMQLTVAASPSQTVVSKVTYTSDNTRIAGVTAEGLVVGYRVGTATITATAYNGVSSTYDITVVKAPTSVVFTNLGSSVGVGEEMQLEYAVPAGSAGFGYFASADNSIIDVSYEGWLSAKKVGKTKVAVATYNNKLKVVDVTVKPAPTDITLSAEEISIGAGDTRVLQYTLNAGSAGSVRYETANPAIASVEQNGAITAHKEGSTEITVETYNGLSKTCKVTVVPAPTEVTLTGERHEIGVGETMQLTVAASPSQTVVSKVTYTSGNTRIAGVTAEGLVVGYRVGTVTITATAYNGVSSTYDITVVKAPTSVVFTNLGSSVGVGEEMQLEYAVPAGSAGFGYFASADNSIIDVSYEGWLSAKKVGKTKVAVATYNNKLKVVDVTVKPAPTDITLSAEEISIGAGDTRVLQYTLNAGSAGSVRYETANPAIASVEQNGAITAHKEGSTEITVETYNGLSKTCKVTVVPAPTEVTLTGERHEIGVGEKMQLSVAASPSQTVVSKVTYTSDNTRIAGVTAEGLVVGYRVGTATITATAYNGVSSTYDITVVKAPTSVAFTNLGSSVGVGEEMQLEYAVPAGTAGFAYFASADNSIIDVSYEGWLSAKKVGKTKVAVATYNNKLKAVDVTVKPAPTDITLSAEEISIGAGDAWTLKYTLNAGSAGSVQFKSMDPAVASVAPDGTITAHQVGSTEIIVETYNKITAACAVTVVPEPTAIDVSSIPTTIGVNEIVELTPRLIPGEAVGTLTYSSSNSKVVLVNEDGLIGGLRVGTATISIKAYNGVTASVNVSVAAAPASVAVSAERSAFGVGEKAQFIATLSKGSAGSYRFESTDSNVIEIDPKTGEATALAEGDAVIRVVTYNNRKAEMQVKVLAAPESITIEPGYASIGVRDTIGLTVSVNEGSAGGYEFESLNPDIASVDKRTGIVTANAEGTARITATAYNGVSASMDLRVLPAPTQLELTAPQMNEDGMYELDLDKGASYQLVLDKGEYTKLDVEFSSVNPEVAMVSDTGLISAKRAGATVVNVNTYNGTVATVWITVRTITDRYPVKTIMHAMGAINGEVYSNSKEAFLVNYANGHRFFEVDFSYTRDGEMVLWHSWTSNRINSATKAGYVPTWKEFKSMKVFDQYTSMDLADLLTLMSQYPDAYFFLDTKLTGAADAQKQYTEIVATAREMGLTSVLDRMVVMIYNKTMYSVVNNIHPFRQYVFMMYKTFSSAPTAAQVRSIASFCYANSIEYISMWDFWWKPAFMDIANEYGLEVNLHTVNSSSAAKQYVESGVSLITSDYLSIKGY